MKKLFSITASILFIVSCGGGGGGGSTPTPTTPTPTVNLSANPVSVLLGSTSTLTWSSNNASSCSASWTNQTGSSGSEAVTISTAGNNSFSITCTGAGGSRSATVTVEGYRNTDGVVVDGYISGAEVCIDEDESWTCDSSESSTTSDNDGKFTIKYANGNLVSIGGTDLDSQTLLDNLLITHKLTGHSDFKAVTPVTSVAAFMTDASLVNVALGIDSSIDISTFDPVANKGDGGVNDYLYEKGNQLTVLAYALQNITNDLNTTTETTQDYFKAITEEIEKEYTETTTKVDIETEEFITKALDNIIEAKTVTITDEAKANTTKALSGVMPVIEVKSSDDLTTSVIRFAVSTLQTDIQAIANGTASAETVASYSSDVLTYIAEDQSIEANEITPDISAIADSVTTSEDTALEINVLLNDSFLTSSPITVTVGNGSNGTTSVASNIVTYKPDTDYNGSDTFSYAITQGDKTSSADVTVAIEAVNDAPTIDIASTIQVAENQIEVTTVSVLDVDEDELTLTLGGTDADSFNLSDDNILTFKEAPDYEIKTSYSITLSLTDGIETVTKDLNLNIQDFGEFYGSAIDGYITGANIFIDQNFNFLKDEGELSAITDSDGRFEILTEDLSLYECLKNRPIIANVPVGAVDSTLGEVTKAYQMILPSLNDNGPEKVVISPFSSLFSEQITNAIADLKLENELTITEGCQSIGDNIASKISIKIKEFKSTLDSLGVTYDELTDNFISSPNGIISETTAQNIAQFLPSITSIKSILKTEMSNNFGFEINPSLIIGQETINVIFDTNRVEDMTEVPITLFTSFNSETNTSGWYKQSTITANESKLDSISNLIPYNCYSSNSQDCLEKDITLDVLANYSKNYRNSVGWFRSVNKNNPVSIGLVVNGSIEVSSSDVRYYDDSNENKLHSCGVEEIIQLTGSKVNEIGHAYQYQTNYNEGTGLQNGCNISSDFRRATIEIRKFGTDVNGNEESLSTSYVTNNIDTSSLFSSKPVNLFNDFEDVNPLGIINEIANLEFNFSKFSSIRSSLASGERVEFRYSLRHSNGQFSKQYVLTLSQISANDSFSMEIYDQNGTITSINNITGIDALQSYSNKILDEAPNTSSIINNTYYSNESPIITSTNTFSVAENQTAIGTVTATDADDDGVTFDVSGSELAITSAGVLTFVSAPDYETKTTYTATVTASDGLNATTQDVTINVSNINDSFSGKVIDGYISGAEIFIDQNFNFIKDSGEYSSTTNTDGSFLINIDDASLFECLKNRPIIANVPVGAVDSTLGEVTKAYQMILPSISDTGNSTIVVSPFTSLLGDAVIQGKSSSGIVEDIAVSASCEEKANTIASSITSELLQVKNTIESSLDISFDDLLIDFIESNNNSIVNEINAQNIAAFLPYFKELSDEFDAELSDIHDKSINTNITIKKDSINSILSDSEILEIPLSFVAIYETDPSDSGWFIQEKINAYGASITKSGEMKHFTCFTDTENCSTTDRSLVALRNASERYTRTSTFLNNSYNPTSYNYQLVIEDEQRVDFDINGNPKDRVCIYQNWLYLVPVNNKENFTTNDRYNTGAADGGNNVDDCISVLENKDEALFVALVDSYDDGTYFEEIDIRITNPRYYESTFFTNKVNNIYQNRNTLDLDPLIQEIALVPRTFKAINDLRNKLTSSSTDQIVINWTKRNAASQITESGYFNINYNSAKDKFEYATYQNSETGSIRTEVISSSGQQARDDLFTSINTKSVVFNNEEFNGLEPVYANEAPIITSASSFDAAENQSAVGTVTATDADGDDLTFAVTGFEIQISSTGVLTFLNDSRDYETQSSYPITVSVSDGVNTVTQDITINITDVNEPPSFGSSAVFSAAENQTSIGRVIVGDQEGDSLTYTLSGADANSVSISTSGSDVGTLTFNSAPDYETKNTYSFTLSVTDGTNTSTQDITVNITNVIENSSPVFTSNSSFTVEENQISVANITVTDADSDSISFSLSGTDADSFAISSSGALTFNAAPDYETKSSYSLIITASDGTVSVSQAFTIAISNINEVPQISALSSNQLPDENQLSVVSVSASDPDASTTLTYSLSGTDSSLFAISSSGVITFKTAPDYEAPGDTDGDNNYQINVVVSDGSLSVTQAITIQVQNVADLISGVAVDGYVAGATVFQDLNNDGDLDSGEPSAATNSLGSFSLNLSSVNINAPVRIINGFDLASNEIHPSIMDISVSETGSYIVTPISTLVGRLKIQDTALSAMVPQSMIAGALGISLADSPNDSILGFDPIAYFNGSDATLASEARPVFAASQLLMTMGGGNYSVHKYITDQVLSTLSSTLTTAAGSSITLSSANDILGLKQDAYDAIFNGYVDTTLANSPPINSIQFRNNKAVMTDYLNGSSSSAVNYSLYGFHGGSNSTLFADLVGAKLDYDNLKQILDNDGTGTPMDLNFELANIPAAGSGSTGVTFKLFYGDDITQDADEDYLQITLTANWESDGTNFKIKLPANSAITASFYDRGGTVLSITPTNQVEDIFTVTKDGPNRPATLSLRLSKLFNAFPTEVTGLSSFLDGAAEFTYLVEFDNFTIYDHLDNPFTKIQGNFEVDTNPGITVFADDIYVHENATSKDISFYLSQAASSDVTLDYAIADLSTASSSDYTLSSGTVTIPAGSMSATLTIPVTNDTTVEAQEEIMLSLSNVQNAVLGRSNVSVFITDGEEILANSAQKAILAENIFKDSKASINAYIKNKLDTSTVTISGTSYTYSQVLINNSVTTDVYAYLDSIIDDYEVLSETLISNIMTKADAYIDAQLSSFADYTAFATALTQLNSGIKGLNMSQIVGTNINTNGTFPSGQNTTTLQTALDGKVDTLVSLAADTVADILGADTNTNFPNANVVMGTDGDDTITGTSGSDLIASFGGTDTVNALAGNDKILGGSGVDTLNGGDDNDHLYGYAGADTLNGNAGDDLIYGGKDDDTIDGDAGDDSLYGEAGDDTITSGAGNDTLDGGLGDDTITIDASGNKTINGSAGTDTLTINYSGISNLGDFTVSASGDYTVLTDSNGNTIQYKNTEDLTVGSIDYTNNTSSKSYYSSTEKAIYMYLGGNVGSSHPAFSTMFQNTNNWSITGSGLADTLNLNLARNPGAVGDPVIGGLFTISLGDGDDTISSAKLVNGDSVNMGAGDDTVSPMFGTNAGGNQTFSNANLTLLDGGAGEDTLSFGESTNEDGVTLSLSIANATNFENIIGTNNAETINGDANSNKLYGSLNGSTDTNTLNGNAGNDFLLVSNSSDGGTDRDWLVTPASGSDLSSSLNFLTKFAGSGNQTLNGGAGDDVLIGAKGEDTLDGGTGRDHLAGGSGIDTFVIRAGDGASSIDDADIVYDFTDGTDVISLDSLAFGDLTISEGTGTYAGDTVIQKTDTEEYLLIISSDVFTFSLGGQSYTFTYGNLSAVDFSTSLVDQTINGTAGDDVIVGGSAVDTITTSTGTDEVYGQGGNDSITVNGTGNKTIDGGAGTDTLTINYSGISNLGDFTVSASGDYTVLTDSNGNTIQYKNIESLVVGSFTYINNTSSKSFYNTTEKAIYMYLGGNVGSSHPAFSTMFQNTNNWSITGSGLADTLNLNLARNPGAVGDPVIGGLFTISLGDGDDTISSAKLVNGDSVNMGAGDDTVSPMFGTNAGGNQTFSNANLTLLDGGAGEDTLSFGESTNEDGVTLSLSIANATNFENIIGTNNAETINGDANSNKLYGSLNGSTDTNTLNGNAGNDFLLVSNSSDGGTDRDWLVTPASGSDLSSSLNFLTKFAGSGNQTLNGGAGDDVLIGAKGEDTLDGGTGRDHLAGGSGIDTFVIRAGDGASSIDDADIVYDFTDGTDVISLDSLAFGDLTISEGTGTYAGDTVIQKTDTEEYLLIISSDVFTFSLGGQSYTFTYGNLSAVDFSTSLVDQTINGTAGDDVIVGGSAVDTITTSTGTDEVYGQGGNDSITVNGTGNKTIDGGAGTDTLTINYSGISNLGDFTVSASGDYTVLTDSNGNTIQYKNIESLVVGSFTYINNTSSKSFYNTTEKAIYMYLGGNVGSSHPAFSTMFQNTNNWSITGSGLADTLNLNLARNPGAVGDPVIGGLFTISLGDGDDTISSAKLVNGDSVNMGAGDDTVSPMFGTNAGGNQTFSNANLTLLDGGAGEDTLSFGESTNEDGVTLSLSIANATNFENIIGTNNAETINGDANSNKLYGSLNCSGVSNTLNGNAGNDFLLACNNTDGGTDRDWLVTPASGSDLSSSLNFITQFNDTANQTLNGGAGDDVLIGAKGEDTLDGGTGRDHLAGGSGIDTFVIRAGDGASSIDDADIVYDFTDGTDLIGMSGLEYSQLTIEQGTGDYTNHVIVKKTDTGEFLVIIQNISLSSISNADFSAI